MFPNLPQPKLFLDADKPALTAYFHKVPHIILMLQTNTFSTLGVSDLGFASGTESDIVILALNYMCIFP